MAFLLADSFQSSLDKLNGDEQKAAKLAAFELQMNPATPGLQCHRLENIKDKNFWSARASRDIRLIFHRVESSVMLCYVGHHDPAYDWASRRKIETHPVTGAAQIVEIRETVREIQIPLYVPSEPAPAPEPKRPLSNLTEDELLSYGVPGEWIPDVRTADDDMLLVIASPPSRRLWQPCSRRSCIASSTANPLWWNGWTCWPCRSSVSACTPPTWANPSASHRRISTP